MISQDILRKYAELAVRIGVNVQPGQLMVLTSPVDCAFFARLCVEEAYRAEAGEVRVNWVDERTDKLRYQYEAQDSMTSIAPWRIEQKQNDIDRQCCFLYLKSSTPGLLADVPGEKLQAVRVAEELAFEKFEFYTMANHGQWSIVAVPSFAWAKKVFPELEEQAALDALWDAVLAGVRIGSHRDAVADWREHIANLAENSRRLNAYHFESLHFQNCLGTDLLVGLAKGHVWEGVSSRADNDAVFVPNMPTEEVFTAPDKYRVNGRVYATKPLNYQGKMIHNFWFVFQDGKVCEYGAESGEDVLKNLVEFDAGSAYLGEVALVPDDSPISRSGLLFLTTLFDENASCHLALGASYPENIAGGATMDCGQLEAAGANQSKEHCDFMFGSSDMQVDGILPDGREIPVFRNGVFAFPDTI